MAYNNQDKFIFRDYVGVPFQSAAISKQSTLLHCAQIWPRVRNSKWEWLIKCDQRLRASSSSAQNREWIIWDVVEIQTDWGKSNHPRKQFLSIEHHLKALEDKEMRYKHAPCLRSISFRIKRCVDVLTMLVGIQETLPFSRSSHQEIRSH